MTACRRIKWNFALDRSIEWARQLKKPLVILEALRCDYPWASERFHRFILDGMAEKARRLRANRNGIFYYPYVETAKSKGKGLIRALSGLASVIVTDDYPTFFLPHMMESAARQVQCRLEAVDSNGLLPLRAADKAFTTAFSFRRFLQKNLAPQLAQQPKKDSLARLELPRLKALPGDIIERWRPIPAEDLNSSSFLSRIPVRRDIESVELRGGETRAETTLRKFLSQGLRQYSELRNQPEAEATSGLSPYLHFGHISPHQIFHELSHHENWSEAKLAVRANGSREGWWGVSSAAEAFLDQIVTWRELGLNFSSHRDDDARYSSLPDWAKRTLAKHRRDEREYVYSLDEFGSARTHDLLWNTAQRQLIAEGRIHNYLRMLWGEKILEWTRKPEDALEIMVELNNRYALDGCDPNSYSGIFWCLGRYDRPWGPERPIFGSVRYMSSESTARKFRLRAYLEKYGPQKSLRRAVNN
jgi:deoxyribodipyrimidine photo-lyase